MAGSTRREFAQSAALAAAGLALADPMQLGRRVRARVRQPLPPARMALARWSPDALAGADLSTAAALLTVAALDALGGMDRFVKAGDVVWIKPNIGWNRPPPRVPPAPRSSTWTALRSARWT
jgi:hypothetical protein